ncbi:hypothetical protein K9M79_01555 [Candidatus Woesearchaeota archaeon]|nr:hypothetical protein [Candidatus Woesearchaeota archaeon]
MDGLFYFIWWCIFLSPTIKVGVMLYSIFSINADHELKLPKPIKNILMFLITVLVFVVGIYTALEGLNLVTYLLIMVICYLILFLVADFFNNKFSYLIWLVMPLFGFLGLWTGSLAVKTQSTEFMELILITIPLFIPYIQYKLIFSDEKLVQYLNHYLEFIDSQKIKIKFIEKIKKELVDFKETYAKYLDSKNLLSKTEKEYSIALSQAENIREIKTEGFDYLNHKKYWKAKKQLLGRDASIRLNSELMSLLVPVAIGGSPEESIIKSIGHINTHLMNNNNVSQISKFYLEFTKAMLEISQNTVHRHMLVLFIHFRINSSDLDSVVSRLSKVITQHRRILLLRHNCSSFSSKDFNKIANSKMKNLADFREEISLKQKIKR